MISFVFADDVHHTLCGSVLLIPCVAGHGSGVWTDPKHYHSAESLAGIRVVSEFPAHILNVVGTDDGTTWWAASGSCSGVGMTKIRFDLSSKGGPAVVDGTWAQAPDGSGQHIDFADGNRWSRLTKPTEAFARRDGVDDHVGVFIDPRLHEDGTSWAGLRVIAEAPPHVLAMVGSDDGDSFWFLKGKCTGADMTNIHFDFSPKGGPTDLVAKWHGAASNSTPLSIVWSASNKWFKAGASKSAMADVHLDWLDVRAAEVRDRNAERSTSWMRAMRFGALALLALLAVFAAMVRLYRHSRLSKPAPL